MRDVIREWQSGDFRLVMYDSGITDWRGQTKIAYCFYDRGELIFEGEDFAGSPLNSDDSDATVGALLNFLSLRPGDTDREYFDSYTPEQLDWAQSRGEELGMLAYELENPQEVEEEEV